jgi:hypothetical protein
VSGRLLVADVVISCCCTGARKFLVKKNQVSKFSTSSSVIVKIGTKMAFSQPLSNVSDQIFLAINERSARKLWRIIKTYETSKVLASLVTFNQEGNTPVQLAICKRHFDVIDALLRPLKESTCNEHYIPLCLFVIFQVLMVKNIPIVEKMEYLVGTTNNNNISWMEFVSDSVNSSSITRLEKIAALELIGVAPL